MVTPRPRQERRQETTTAAPTVNCMSDTCSSWRGVGRSLTIIPAYEGIKTSFAKLFKLNHLSACQKYLSRPELLFGCLLVYQRTDRSSGSTPNPFSSHLFPLTATSFNVSENSTVFSPSPTSDVDATGRKRFVGQFDLVRNESGTDEGMTGALFPFMASHSSTCHLQDRQEARRAVLHHLFPKLLP